MKHEVDVVQIKDTVVPIEIKYGKIEVAGLIKFMEKFNIEHGYVISPYTQERQTYHTNKIEVVSAIKYLLKESDRQTNAQGKKV